MKVSMSVDIDAPPGRVWPYLVEPEKTKSWYTMLEKFEYTSDEPGPGSTLYWEENARGHIYWNHFRTTEWVENRVFAFEMTSSSFFKAYTQRWQIEPAATGCRFSLTDELVFPYGLLGKGLRPFR